jgi:hypothetical protein
MGATCTWEQGAHGSKVHMGAMCTWGNVHMGAMCTWGQCAHRGNVHMGAMGTWEQWAHGSNGHTGAMGTREQWAHGSNGHTGAMGTREQWAHGSNGHMGAMYTWDTMPYHSTPCGQPPLQGRRPAAVLVHPWIPHGEIHDQGDAKWIVIRRSLWGHNDMPCRWPAPGRPIGRLGSGHPQGIMGGFSYY